MVIKFVPKPKEEVPLGRKIAAFIVLLIFFGTIFLSFSFFYEARKINKNLKDIEEKIAKERTEERVSLEKEVKISKERIDAYSDILEDHIFPSKIFSFLEENTDPYIAFTSFNFEKNSMRVNLEGEAKDFSSLQREISLLREKDEIEDPELSDIKISSTNEGKRKIKFSLSFFVKKSFIEK